MARHPRYKRPTGRVNRSVIFRPVARYCLPIAIVPDTLKPQLNFFAYDVVVTEQLNAIEQKDRQKCQRNRLGRSRRWWSRAQFCVAPMLVNLVPSRLSRARNMCSLNPQRSTADSRANGSANVWNTVACGGESWRKMQFPLMCVSLWHLHNYHCLSLLDEGE